MTKILVAVSLEVFNFWTHSVLDHHTISSSGISEKWCRRYKQLMYLQNTDVLSKASDTQSLTKACVSLTPPPRAPESSIQRTIDPIHLRLACRDQAGSQALSSGFPPRSTAAGHRGATVREGGEGKAQAGPMACTLSCRASALQEWAEQKISARNYLLSP